MKNNNKLFLLSISLLLFFSCKKEEHGIISKAQSTSELKNLYEAKIKKTELISASLNSNSNPNINPRGPKWNEAKSFHLDNEEIIEIPLTFKFNRGLQDFNNTSSSVSDPEKLNIQKLVFIKRENGQTDVVFMTIVPNSNILPKYDDFHYKKVPGNFDGFVLFHDIKDSFINGWRYEKGKVSKTLSNESFRDQPKTNTDGLSLTDPTHNDCYTVVITRWCQDCTDWYVNGVYDRTACGSAYVCGQYSFLECETSTDGTGGGGGGGTPPPTGGTPSSDYGGVLGSLCANYKFSVIGTSFNSTIRNLRYLFKSPDNIWFPISYAESCLSVANYNINEAQASAIFNKAFNRATSRVVYELDARIITPIQIQLRLKVLTQNYLKEEKPGSTWSAVGGCGTYVPVTNIVDSHYCLD